MLTDINGNLISVGDIIIRPVFSVLARHQVLGITQNTIKVSVFRRPVYKSYKTDYYSNNDSVINHNSELYIQRNGKFPQIILVEKRDLTMEDINQYKQIKPHGSNKSS